jgi:DNA-binding response OmpR family regulator
LLTELVKAVLELNHHSVTTADGGESGLAKFYEAKAAGTPFDLVITDLGMPHVDGSQVARRIKSDSPQTPVVMLTGWGALVREDGGSDTPVDAVLSKPPRVEELLATVGSLRAA